MTNKGFVFQLWAGITAILVLAASVGIAIDVHFCHDSVKSIGVYTLADECSTVESESSNFSIEMCEDSESLSCEDCCHNESFFNKISTEVTFQINKNQSLVSHVIEPNWQISRLELISSDYAFADLGQYVPLPKNRQVLFQSFLI